MKLWPILIALMLCGACTNKPAFGVKPVSSAEVANRVASVAMHPDHSITVRWFNVDHELFLRAGDGDYENYLANVGGLAPGETKYIHSYRGVVRMNADHSLTVTWLGGVTTVEDPPHTETVQPTDPKYDAYLAMVGGLRPGISKFIPRDKS